MDSFGEVPERRSQLLGEMDDTQLNPEWLQKTSALVEGGLNSGWRPGATGAAAVQKIPSRFDTTSGPARWKDEGNGRRLDGGAGAAGDRWTEVGPGGSHLAQAFPTDLFSSGDRWAAPDPSAGRGRGRGMGGFQDPPATWKSRDGAPAGAPQGAAGGPEWRGAGSEVNPRNDWRNDRWNAAPGSRNSQDTWRGAGGPGGGGSAGRSVGGPVGFNSGAPGGGLGGGGFSIGRGSGTFTRSDSINSANGGAGRGGLAASGRSPSSSFFRSFGPGGGVGGSLAWGPSKAQLRYTTDQLAFVYRQLLYSGRLKLPSSIERDDPLLFIADGDFVDVVEQFSGVDPRISAELYLEHQALMQRVHSRGFLPSGGSLGGDMGSVGGIAMSPPQGQLQGLPEDHQLHQQQMHHRQMQQQQQPHSAFIDPSPPPQQQQPPQQQMMGAPDPGWVYRDPQGMLQGPFPKQDIVEWFEGGFFPLELQLRPATDPPNAPFYPLSDLLKIWTGPAAPMMGGPIGFTPQQHQQSHGFVDGMGMPQELLQQQQQQQGNAATVFMGQQVPQQAQQQVGGLSDDLMLSGHLQHLSMDGLGAPQQQQQQQQQQQLSEEAFAPAPFDPIVDPALVKRSASTNVLVQQEPLGGGLLGSQQQQQEESLQPAWSAAPAAPPAAAAQSGGSLSLAAIQEEEQRLMREEEEQRRQQQQQQMVGAGGPPPPPPRPQGPAPGYEMEPPSPQRQRPETKVAPWVAAVPTPESAGKTLLEIQAEEAERQAQLEAQLAQQAAANRLAAGPPGGGWARVARGTTVSGPASGPSLLEIQQAEERAKAAVPAPAAEEDDGLFWEYDKPASGGASGNRHNAVMPPPPPAPKPKVGGWAAAASKAPVAVPISAKPNGAAASARPATIAVIRPPPPPPPRGASSSAMPAFVPPSASDEDMAAILAAAAGESGGDGTASSALSGPFRSWCVEQMQELTGSFDVTLCEFLMTVESNSEVAEYVSTYLGVTPTAAKFTAEFLKLKLAEQASGGKKSRKARAKANAAAAALANGGASTAAGKSGGKSGAAAGDDDTDSSWAQVSDAASKKAKKKGQKVEGAMLGFASGTNYSLLDNE